MFLSLCPPQKKGIKYTSMVEIAFNAFAVFLHPLLVLAAGCVSWGRRCSCADSSPSPVRSLSEGRLGATAEPGCPDGLWKISRIWEEEGERVRSVTPGFLRGFSSCNKDREESCLFYLPSLGCFFLDCLHFTYLQVFLLVLSVGAVWLLCCFPPCGGRLLGICTEPFPRQG